MYFKLFFINCYIIHSLTIKKSNSCFQLQWLSHSYIPGKRHIWKWLGRSIHSGSRYWRNEQQKSQFGILGFHTSHDVDTGRMLLFPLCNSRCDHFACAMLHSSSITWDKWWLAGNLHRGNYSSIQKAGICHEESERNIVTNATDHVYDRRSGTVYSGLVHL